MVFKHPLELENLFNGLVDDLWEVGRVVTQELYHLDRFWMIYPFIELGTLLFDPSLFIIDLRMSRANPHVPNH